MNLCWVALSVCRWEQRSRAVSSSHACARAARRGRMSRVKFLGGLSGGFQEVNVYVENTSITGVFRYNRKIWTSNVTFQEDHEQLVEKSNRFRAVACLDDPQTCPTCSKHGATLVWSLVGKRTQCGPGAFQVPEFVSDVRAASDEAPRTGECHI